MHLIRTASHERLLIKVSFKTPLSAATASVGRQQAFGGRRAHGPSRGKKLGSRTALYSQSEGYARAEVGVEIKRGFGAPIQRKYFVTLRDVGSGEWQIESMEFATRY